jgi:hypothetical protein
MFLINLHPVYISNLLETSFVFVTKKHSFHFGIASKVKKLQKYSCRLKITMNYVSSKQNMYTYMTGMTSEREREQLGECSQ